MRAILVCFVGLTETEMWKEISVVEEQVNRECRSRGILFLIYLKLLICDIISVSTERKL